MNVSREYFLIRGSMGWATNDFSLSDELHIRGVAAMRTCNLFSDSLDDWQLIIQCQGLLADTLTPVVALAPLYARISVNYTSSVVNGSRSPPR